MARLEFKHFVIFIVALCASSARVGAQLQELQIFDKENGQGESVILSRPIYIPDLGLYGFNNRARSVCVKGIWMFYDNLNWNPEAMSKADYVFSNSTSNCVNLANVNSTAKSVRFAGYSTDYASSSITFYLGTHFQGEEHFVSGDRPNLYLVGRTKSLLITGRDAWTVYTSPNYSGNATCVFPPDSTNFEPAFIYDTTVVNVAHNSISSVRKGCQT